MPDRQSLIGRHRSNAVSGWQRANPTGQRTSGTTIGSSRSSGWQRANPTGQRGGSLMGSHRSAPAEPVVYNDHDDGYNNIDEPVVYNDYDDGYNNADEPVVYNDYDDGYNNADGPRDLGYTTSIPFHAYDAPPRDLGYSDSRPSHAYDAPPRDLGYSTTLSSSRADDDHYGSYIPFVPGLSAADERAPAEPAAPRPDAGLKRKQRVAKYEGEESGVTWRAMSPERFAQRNNLDPSSPEFAARYEDYKKNNKAITTDYHTAPEQREQTRLKERAGGRVKATHLRNDGSDFSFSESENVGWVMDPSTADIHTFDPGRMVTKPNGERVTTHHTTPLAGGDVAGAGIMKLKNGHIQKVTDESGHYRPEAEYTHQSVAKMAERGLLDRKADEDEVDEYEAGEGNLSAKVELSGYDPADPRQGKQWLADKDYHQGALKLPYQAFLQTQGNEVQARKKVTMQEELLSKVDKVKRHKPSGRQDRGEAPVASAPDQVESNYFTEADFDRLASRAAERDSEGDESESEQQGPSPLGLSSFSYQIDPNDPDKRIWG